MSNALAIAAVSAVLKDLLDNGVIDAPLDGTVAVSVKPPDRALASGATETAQLNLFLYHVANNPGWRNEGLPARDAAGVRISNPPLALDLFYMLTAYGETDFQAEILLGYAMQLLHETPVLTREAIRKSLSQPASVSGAIGLSAANLAEQVEQVKLTLQPLSIDEMSKLWSAFQAKYRPSVAYQASLVLIESQRPTRAALPVLTRGRPDPVAGRDPGVIVQPNLLPPFPTLQAALPPDKQSALRMGETLTVQGHHLVGDPIVARFTHMRSASTLDLPVVKAANASEGQIPIPTDPATVAVDVKSPLNPDNWRAGIYRLLLTGKQVDQEHEWMTNELPVVLAPTIKEKKHETFGESAIFTITCAPKVGKTQRVSLVVGSHEILAEALTEELSAQLTFKLPAAQLPRGKQWLRLRVDGAESILVKRAGQQPVFDESQQVEL